jgi:hypothetical protein
LNVVKFKKNKMQLTKQKMNNTFKNKITWKFVKTNEKKKTHKKKIRVGFFP